MRLNSPLQVALRSPLPGTNDALFLRACLPSGEPGREAFERWRHRFEDPIAGLRHDASAWRGLLPLLQVAVRHNGVTSDPELMSVLRAARAHEELRAEAMKSACRDALAALADHGICVTVLGAIALTETVYREWGLRHSHDIDLLVDAASIDEATRILGGNRALPGDDVRLALPSGVLITLHTCLYPDRYYAVADFHQRRRAIGAEVAQVAATVLDPVDTLLHLCGRSACGGSVSPLWAVDSWHLIDRNLGLDWALLLDRARQGGLVLAASTRLSWLAEALGANVPARVLTELARAAQASDPLAAEVLLHQTRHDVGSRALLRNLGVLRSPPIVLRLLFPSSAYLRLRSGRSAARSGGVLRAEQVVRYSSAVWRGRRASPHR